MCNFIKSNGEQCKLARNKDRCGKHQIIVDREEIIVEETNIVEEMPPKLSTPAVAEVIHTPEPSAIKPVESSNVKVSEVPNVDESIVAPAIADSMVYKEDQSLDSKLNISDADAKGITWDTCGLEHDNKDIFRFSEVIDAWRSLAKEIPIDHQSIKNADPQVLFDQGYISPIQLENRKDGKVTSRKRIYFKSVEDKETFLGLYKKLTFVEYCVSSGLYDQRLYKLCCMMKRDWYCNNNNTWNLAGMFYRMQHVDLGLMRKTYLCILHTMTDRFDHAAALKVFNDWETSKYHPKLSESQIKSIAGGTNPIEYSEWKEEYEPKEIKEKRWQRKENAFGYSQREAD
ncbi:unnamed protein product [Phytophthora lilii]|uniref:Unnamed protein product n=1 Tax=Phytophthora lilii TaxID=2077276 RepID=A0A9W6TZB7_9STRA|nr:unnamed protein product [Phytophthora lilii]